MTRHRNIARALTLLATAILALSPALVLAAAPQTSATGRAVMLEALAQKESGKFDPKSAGTSALPGLAKQQLNAGVAGLPVQGAFKALKSLGPDKGLSRDLRDTQLFKTISPSVVLVTTDDGLGSGSLIDRDGTVLTNYHVIEGFSIVSVLFKPTQPGAKLSPKDAISAKVIRVNIEKDLALLKLASVPPGVEPITFGKLDDVQIGADVHAIGHPKGEAWTYTKGIVSQIRADYDWSGGDRVEHRATVIQTQTPINSGNSGGPLLDETGRLVGVNSFGTREAENLNFAVSVADVESLLKQAGDVGARKTPLSIPFKETRACPEPQVIYQGPNYDRTADLQILDTRCTGKANAQYILPRDERKPMILALFRDDPLNRTVVYTDSTRRADWEMSFWREDVDRDWETACYHENGGLSPTRCEDYAAYLKAANEE